jgi:hypothetical protein
LEKNDNDTKRSRCYSLQNSEAKYVIIGIPEDIRANFETRSSFSMGNCD